MTNLDVHVVKDADIETRWAANLWRHLPCTESERIMQAWPQLSDVGHRGHKDAGFLVITRLHRVIYYLLSTKSLQVYRSSV